MRLRIISGMGVAILVAAALPAFAGPHLRRGPTAQRLAHGRSSRFASRASAASHISMSPERATELQTALIKAGYMTGTPSGAWDAPSQSAMEKLQSDNGWQTKLVPDSRAIIKLGLGPNAAVANQTGASTADGEISSTFPANAVHPANQ